MSIFDICALWRTFSKPTVSSMVYRASPFSCEKSWLGALICRQSSPLCECNVRSSCDH